MAIVTPVCSPLSSWSRHAFTRDSRLSYHRQLRVWREERRSRQCQVSIGHFYCVNTINCSTSCNYWLAWSLHNCYASAGETLLSRTRLIQRRTITVSRVSIGLTDGWWSNSALKSQTIMDEVVLLSTCSIDGKTAVKTASAIVSSTSQIQLF